jgi:hypothetical protein
MKIYLSGAISADTNHEYKFNAAERLWKKQGAEVVNPVTLAKKLSRFGAKEYKDYLLYDLECLAKCDAIYMLKDWEFSPGARAEFEFAKACGIQFFYEAKGV